MQTVMLGLAMAAGALNPGPNNSPEHDANPNPGWDEAWAERESWALSGHVQLTSEAEFAKAGESYFSPDGNMIIFQGTPRPEAGAPEDRHYGMYVAGVVRDERGTITGLSDPLLLSEPGSANTCGWFHPTDFSAEARRYRVLFGSTVVPPDDDAASGYQRGTSRYTWQFPNEMDIYAGEISAISFETELTIRVKNMGRESVEEEHRSYLQPVGDPSFSPVWTRDGYDAEGSWSPDGRHILYTRLKPGSEDGDLWVYDTENDTHTELVAEEGYDGGPFFSPCGTRICYRSDRRGDKALQLFIAELAFDDAGAVTGVEREIPITDNEHVNWAPFFTPDGTMLFYATSAVSHSNYEVFAIDATGDAPPRERPSVRITDARGFDGLPVFSPDGGWMMWTAQRGALASGETRPSSQLWAARIDLDAVRERLEDERRRIADRLLEESFEEFMPGG